MTVADNDDTDYAGSGDVMALGSTELTTYLLNSIPTERLMACNLLVPHFGSCRR